MTLARMLESAVSSPATVPKAELRVNCRAPGDRSSAGMTVPSRPAVPGTAGRVRGWNQRAGKRDRMKVAIVHYWLVGMRGGEKVVEALCEMFPEADIFTHAYVPDA